jgi:hypothetical protein
MVLLFIASLKVTATVVLLLTPAAPFGGVNAVTVGGVVSPPPLAPAVVNDQETLPASAFPARSLTPSGPPTTVAEYVVPPTSGLVGVSVAIRVASLYEIDAVML